MLNWVIFPVPDCCCARLLACRRCRCRRSASGRMAPDNRQTADSGRKIVRQKSQAYPLTSRLRFRIESRRKTGVCEEVVPVPLRRSGEGFFRAETEGKSAMTMLVCRHRLRPAFCPLRHLGDAVGACGRPGQCTHAGDRRRHPRGCAGLSRPPVHDHRHRRRRGVPARLVAAVRHCRDRLPDRRSAFGRRRLHRHARLGARQCAHRAGGLQQPGRRSRHRLQVRRHHRHAGCRPRAARRLRLLLDPDRPDGPRRRQRPRGHRRAGGARLRRLADLDLRPSRRRHLHQGRRRRRRPRRQGRGRHPRGRSAQPGHDRRQRRRQCRRLRRHGGGPVRDLCGDRRRDHGARLDLLRRHARCSAP